MHRLTVLTGFGTAWAGHARHRDEERALILAGRVGEAYF
jgi:hypothetical protein